MSSFAADSKFELVTIKVSIRGRQGEKQGYTRLLNIESYKLSLADFYDEYIKPESEIESFYFFEYGIIIVLKDYKTNENDRLV